MTYQVAKRHKGRGDELRQDKGEKKTLDGGLGLGIGRIKSIGSFRDLRDLN